MMRDARWALLAVLAGCTISTTPSGSPMSNCAAGHTLREHALRDGSRQRYCWADARMQADGAFREFYPSGALRWSGTFAEGARSGDWFEHYPGGQLSQVARYTAGMLDGPFAMWYEGGAPLALRRYASGRQCGLAVEWSLDGREVYRRDFGPCTGGTMPMRPPAMPLDCGSDRRVGEAFPMGRAQWCERDNARQGAFIAWYPDGAVRERSTWNAGSLDGPFESLHANGVSAERGAYRAGQREGMWVTTWESGATREMGAWRMGRRDGAHAAFRADGSPAWSRGYAMDVLEGESRTYFDNGAVEESATYRAGLLHGPRAMYFASGTISWQLPYVDGRGEGEYVEWLPDGRIRKRIPFRAGCREGRGQLWGYPTNLPGVDHEEIEGVFRDCAANGLFGTYNVDASGRRWYAGETLYRNDVAEGDFVLLYESGRRRVEGRFLAGWQEGLWRWYADNDSHDVIAQCTYGLGERLSGTCMTTMDIPGADARAGASR